MLYDLLIMLRHIQIAVFGKGCDVCGIKVSHKIGTFRTGVDEVFFQSPMMALPPSGYHPVDFAIQLRSVFIRRVCDARKQYFPRKRYKGNFNLL